MAAVTENHQVQGDHPGHHPPIVPYPVVPLVDIVNGQAVHDLSFLDKRPDWSYAGEESDSHTWPAQHLAGQPVTVSQPHVREGVARPGGRNANEPEPEPFTSIHASHDVLETQLVELRGLPPAERLPAIKQLEKHLHRHAHVASTILYPLIDRLAPDIGNDIAWYPRFHEENAERLLQRLAAGSVAITDQMLDDVVSDVHATVIEIDRRVLPMLSLSIGDDSTEIRRIRDACDALLE